MRVITYAEALQMLEEARDSKPADFRYIGPEADTAGSGCFYLPRPDLFPSDDPRSTTGCLIGTAFKLHGLPVPDVEATIGEIDWEGYEFTHKAMRLLRATQEAQDDGETWPSAVYKGVRAVSLVNWNRDEIRNYL